MKIVYIRALGVPIRGEYDGGPYIDLFFSSDTSAFEVINVWDYAAGRSRIENTGKAVIDKMVEWKEAAGDSLAHDLVNYAISIGRARP